MSENISKVELEKIRHSVRASQAILQYGVGAMVDFPEQTLVTSAPEFWGRTVRIFDDRFAKALNVDFFALPMDIAYARFPEWYFCPKCRKFQSLTKWINEYQTRTKPKYLEKDVNMVSHMQCTTCRQDLVVARIVTVCDNGHLNDFPWVKWTHARAKKPICASPSLKFKTGASGTEGLEGLTVVCTCGARTTLKDAFNAGVFEKMDAEEGTLGYRCEGMHPFKHTREKCNCYPRTVQRGASMVYFPNVYSSLVIPPYANKINVAIEKSKAYEDCVAKIEDEDTLEEKNDLIQKKFSKWCERIALEVGYRKADVEKLLSLKWLETADAVDASSIQYRFEEYMALNGEITTPKESLGDFCRETISAEQYNILHVKSIALINKVRVVNALTGFSRVNPVSSNEDQGFVCVKKPETRWYPANEVRGEGIFIEFRQEDIDAWIEENPEVVQRAEMLNENYAKSYIGKHHPREITPKLIMLHTISHLLITQLSFECGYSVASLSERLYCSEVNDGKQMAGIFIYTASGDSEGTLGGLVRQGRPDAFPNIFVKAINFAKTCSNDSVCIMSHGQGRDSLNLAACHTCALLPETCCEERNSFLDRGMIIGTFEKRDIGFWSKI